MGSCAGCEGPQRRMREQKNTSGKRHNNTVQHIKTVENDHSLSNVHGHDKNNRSAPKHNKTALDTILNDSMEKAWKNRIATKTVKQYIKPSTLRD